MEESVHDLERHTVTFVMKPDHYADRLRSSGTASYEAVGDDRTRRLVEGEVVLRVPLVLGGGRTGRLAEEAIVSGLREHLAGEAEVVKRLLADL